MNEKGLPGRWNSWLHFTREFWNRLIHDWGCSIYARHTRLLLFLQDLLLIEQKVLQGIQFLARLGKISQELPCMKILARKNLVKIEQPISRAGSKGIAAWKTLAALVWCFEPLCDLESIVCLTFLYKSDGEKWYMCYSSTTNTQDKQTCRYLGYLAGGKMSIALFRCWHCLEDDTSVSICGVKVKIERQRFYENLSHINCREHVTVLCAEKTHTFIQTWKFNRCQQIPLQEKKAFYANDFKHSCQEHFPRKSQATPTTGVWIQEHLKRWGGDNFCEEGANSNLQGDCVDKGQDVLCVHRWRNKEIVHSKSEFEFWVVSVCMYVFLQCRVPLTLSSVEHKRKSHQTGAYAWRCQCRTLLIDSKLDSFTNHTHTCAHRQRSCVKSAGSSSDKTQNRDPWNSALTMQIICTWRPRLQTQTRVLYSLYLVKF